MFCLNRRAPACHVNAVMCWYISNISSRTTVTTIRAKGAPPERMRRASARRRRYCLNHPPPSAPCRRRHVPILLLPWRASAAPILPGSATRLSPAPHPLMSRNPLIAPEPHTLAKEFIWNADHTLHDWSLSYEKLARRTADEIRVLLAARRVQTNEVGRCRALFPAFVLTAKRVKQIPPALIKVGSSARRTICHVAVGPHAWHAPIVLRTLRARDRTAETLAGCDQHERWLECLDVDDTHDPSL